MIVRELTLRNFGPYRGEHMIKLEAKAYGVAATLEGDDERSNWLGKSTIMKAIAWALYGWRDRETTQFDDDVITDDRDGQAAAKETMVRLNLGEDEEILTVERSKALDRSAKLKVHWEASALGERDALGDEAQKIILERVGLSERDFFWSAYFEQKRIARFLDAKPAERLEVAAEWFGFGPLQDAEERLRRESVRIADAVDLLRRRDAELRDEARRLVFGDGPQDPGVDGAGTLRGRADRAQEAAQEAERALARLEGRRDELAALSGHSRDLARYQEVVLQGRQVADELRRAGDKEALSARSKELRDRHLELAGAERVAFREFRQKRELAAGQFDGQCPVAGRRCPVADEINQDRDKGVRLAMAAEKAHAGAALAHEVARQEFEEVAGVLQRIDQLEASLASLREEARRLKASAQRAHELGAADPREREVLDRDVQVARNELASANLQVRMADAAAQRYGKLASDHAALDAQIDAGERELATHREALAVFGRNGAQRRIAEGALREIEQGANRTLAECGIDLTMRVRWGREGKGQAATCEACGTPFGRSERVKRCDRCGAERGPAVQHRLDLEPSARSGAADDLCGVAFQLAAARWLRQDRLSGWGTILIDEPFGSLDAANRRAFANHLATRLASEGFRQAIVIAHHGAIVDSLPGRIDIFRALDGTTKVNAS